MITVLGESLMDLVQLPRADSPAEHPGGSPANVALGLARLGHAATLVTQLGEDPRGRRIRAHLARSGVRVQSFSGNAPTGTATAALDEHGGAAYRFDLTWDLPTELPLPTGFDCLHTGSIATAMDPGAQGVEALLANLRRAGMATVSLDPNIRPTMFASHDAARQRVESQVALADIVKVSDEDLAWLYPAAPAEVVAEEWRSLGPAIVVVTLGGSGALAVAKEHRVRRPAPSIQVADTVGAGDSFTAAMLHWLETADLLGDGHRSALRTIAPDRMAEMLDTAISAAAITCTRPGADPPSLEELHTEE